MRVDRSKLRKALDKRKEEDDKTKGGFVDERIWKPEIPKKDKNIYRLRVLPFGNEVPWTKLLQHQIKTKNGFWYENCPSTIGKDCPICDRAYELYQTEDETDAIEAGKLYKKKVYFSNILVVKDGRSDGDNEGKVFLYKYGQKVFNKFYSALYPNEEEGEEELFFIGEEDGYDFLLTAKTVAGFANYDESKFSQKSSPIAKSDKKIDAILEGGYDLEAEIAEGQFKSFDELQKLFEKNVLGKKTTTSKPESKPVNEDSSDDDADDFDDDFEDDKVEDDDTSSDDGDQNDAVDDDDDLLDDLDDFDE